MHYVIKGDGPDVVLLHGFLSDGHYWDRLATELAATHRVVIVDLLGFGRSPKPRGNHYSLAAHADAVAETLGPLLGAPAAVVGHSMGGLVACQLSLAYPALTRRLLLSNMPVYTGSEQAKATLAGTGKHYKLALYSPAGRVLWPLIKFAAPRGRLQPRVMAGFIHRHTHASRTYSLKGTIEAVNGLELLGRLQVPATLIVGLKDRLVYRQNLAGSHLPANITVAYVPTGHHTPLVMPQELLARIP